MGRTSGKGFSSRVHGVKVGSRNSTSDQLKSWIKGALRRWSEALVPLWVRVGMTLNNWNNVFKVLRE